MVIEGAFLMGFLQKGSSTSSQSHPRLTNWIRLLNGSQTLGRGRGFWAGFLLIVVLAGLYPAFTDAWAVGNTAYFFCWIFMALGLSLIWGYSGALSFGQTAFSELPVMRMASSRSISALNTV